MKVYIGPYLRYIGPYQIAQKILFWKNTDDPTVTSLGDFLEHGFGKNPDKETVFAKLCNWIYTKRKRKVKVRIDPWDSWNADQTLSLIILSVLKQLRESKYGSPFVEYDDVPEHLRPDHNEVVKMLKDDPGWVDEKFHDRWEWVIGEMIWAFEQVCSEDDEMQFYEYPEDMRGDITSVTKQIKIDHDGLKAHKARKQNGFRLFGRYFSSLWD